MRTVRYELWQEDGTFTLCEEGGSAQALVAEDASLVRVFEADTWAQAMTQYHAYMGWDPYKPQ